jgi:hypothetical protein
MSQERRLAWPGVVPALAMLASVALGGGALITTLHPWRSDASADEHRHPASVRSLTFPGGPPASTAPTAVTTVRLPAGADSSATAAVATYLRARSDGDTATSYALLSAIAKRSFPTEATWVNAVADLPAPATFLVSGHKDAGGGTEVSVDVRRTPVLNSFVGFVPARAIEVYRAVRSGAGWRVDAQPVRVTPNLISDRSAAADVTAWLNRLAACDTAGAAPLQVSADLLGDAALPQAICAQHTRLRAAPVRPVVGGPSTAAFLAAYGPDLGSWARLVPVTGPSQQLLVGVAPLGPSWRVFGIVSGGID